jgi:tRNA(fMet)-specific endonuclease VapC
MDEVLLDTDILSEILKRRDETVIRRALEYQLARGSFTISVLTVLEVVSGWHRLRREDRVQEFLRAAGDLTLLPFDTRCAVFAGRIEADRVRTGRPIGRADSMIAATALAHGCPLVTGNVEHYQRVVDLGYPLGLENWRSS